MALTADIDGIDLVVEPSTLTPEDAAFIRSEIEKLKTPESQALSARARRLIRRRRASFAASAAAAAD
jgi:hypothetical protein